MTGQSSQQNRLYELIYLMLDGKITAEQFAELENQLAGDPEARAYYNEYIEISSMLRRHGNESAVSLPDQFVSEHSQINQSPALDESFNKEVKPNRKIRPAADADDSSAFWEVIEQDLSRNASLTNDDDTPEAEPVGRRPRTLSGVPSSKSIFKLLGALAAVVAFAVILNTLAKWGQYTPPDEYYLATLTDAVNAEWDSAIAVGDKLKRQLINLKEGYAGFTFNDGSYVIFEGPTTFTILSEDSVYLDAGRLYAKMGAGSARFAVKTRNARIVDIGTEFGVATDDSGNSEVHVIDGEVILYTSDQHNKTKKQHIFENQACRVDSERNTHPITIAKTAFARSISSDDGFVWNGDNIDLADIVGGGNGTGTGNYTSGIDVFFGNIKEFELKDFRDRDGPDGFIPVSESPFIDGVFVPDGGVGDVQITSAGDIFAQCRDTDGRYWTKILNGYNPAQGNLQAYWDMTLNGRKYGSPNRPGIFMHANCGITFDLEAIRSSTPGCRISGFKTTAGATEKPQVTSPSTYLDVTILIDGVIKHQRNDMFEGNYDDISFNINEDDKFLTLIITDGGNTLHGDFGMFAEPRLVLSQN